MSATSEEFRLNYPMTITETGEIQECFIDNMAYITYTKGEERMTFEVIAYENVNGKIPVQDFLKQLTPKMRAKMYGMLEIQTAKKWRIDFIERMAENENLK